MGQTNRVKQKVHQAKTCKYLYYTQLQSFEPYISLSHMQPRAFLFTTGFYSTLYKKITSFFNFSWRVFQN